MKSEEKRFAYIDLLETIALIFVIAYHSTIFPYDILYSKGKKDYICYILRTFFSCGVPLFFLANGFLLFGKDFNLAKHLRKTIRLTLLTIIWGILLLLIIMPIANVHFTSAEFWEALWTWKLGWINQLWYMGALICIYILFPMLKTSYDVNKKIFFCFIIVCAVMTLGNDFLNMIVTYLSWKYKGTHYIYQENWFNMFNPFRGIYAFSFVYFCIGGVLRTIQNKLITYDCRKTNILGLAALMMSVLLLALNGIFYTNLSGIFWDSVWSGYSSIFTLIAVISIFILCFNLNIKCKGFELISQNTLGIYFIHVPLILLTMERAKSVPFFCNFAGNIVYSTSITVFCCIMIMLLKRIPILKELVK